MRFKNWKEFDAWRNRLAPEERAYRIERFKALVREAGNPDPEISRVQDLEHFPSTGEFIPPYMEVRYGDDLVPRHFLPVTAGAPIEVEATKAFGLGDALALIESADAWDAPVFLSAAQAAEEKGEKA